MTNKLQTIIGKLEEGNSLELVGEIFSNEIIFDVRSSDRRVFYFR